MWLLLAAIIGSAAAEKTVYIPASWSYNATTQEYTEGGNTDLQWSFNRSKQSENCIVFWQKGFGDDPKTSSPSFDVDAVLRVAETCYALNVGTLGFSNSNMLTKYKLMILMNYTTDWVCYGGGYDFECSALWIGPSAVSPAGHSLAHEVGHSFHYMCYAEAANYNHNSSSTDNTGFHLSCGSGQAIWEQTAQWQANQAYPELMFSQSMGVFRYSHNYAFSHEWQRYQSYWFHYYLCQHYNDITTVAQVWKQPMKNQTSGNGSDFNEALMALKGLSVSDLYKLYFDYACRLVTWDLDACKPYRDPYIGQFEYRCALTDDGEYQVALASCPQATGFNVIPLQVPKAGTEVTTHFTGLTVGSSLLDADPGQYLNGNSSYTAFDTRKYVIAGARSARGFRVGYVALMQDGTRRYFNTDTIYNQGIKNTTDDIRFTAPEGISRLWLVVSPALKTYYRHKWDDKIDADDMWPYKVSFEGTDIGGSALVYASPTLDGRDIADLTLTYDVTIPYDASGYSGTSIPVSGRAAAALGTAFQMETSSITSKLKTWSANGPSNNTIMFYASKTDGTLIQRGSTANGYGHWFSTQGDVVDYGNGYLYSEFAPSTLTFYVGQYPARLQKGQTYTISQTLRYRKNLTHYANARFVFNITVGDAASASLSDIDYDDPTVGIHNVNDNANTNQAIYDLSGRRTSKMSKGIYIQNGRKIAIR